MPNNDVIAICNALIDLMTTASDSDLENFCLKKGAMHLVEADVQRRYLEALCKEEVTIELGGSSLNALRVMAAMGHPVGFVGTIGQDSHGSQIQSRMEELGINSYLQEVNEPTGTCLVAITPDGERTMMTCLSASRSYKSSHIPTDAIKDAKILHFCGYQWDTDGQKEAIYEAMKVAKDEGTLISFDAADPFVIERNRDAFAEVIKDFADIVFANQEEAKLLYDSSPEEAAAEITKHGAIAVMKLGAKGALVQKGSEKYTVAPVSTEVVDTTAAGDTFAGGFLSGLLSDKPLETCGRIAATVASDVISRVGTTVDNGVLRKAKEF